MNKKKLMEKLSEKMWLWQILDSFLCIFVFFPVMVLYWRGIWDLFGVYIFPNEHPKFEWVTTAFGALSIVGFYAVPLLNHLLSGTQNKVLYVVVTRVYLYLYGVLHMAIWRGVWGVADYYLVPFGWKAAAVGLCVGHVILLVFRCSRTTIFPPFLVKLDTREDLLILVSCFKTQVNWRKPWSVVKYSLDSLFSQFVIVTASIISWRSSFSLMDCLLFPNDWLLSNLVAFFVGMALTSVLFFLETPLSLWGTHIQKNYSYLLRLIYEDFIYVLAYSAELLAWRGAWNLDVLYIITDPKVGGWVNHVVGTVLMLSLQLMSYAGYCGVIPDGTEINSKDAIYYTKYLQHYLRPKQQTSADSHVTPGTDGNIESSNSTISDEKKEENGISSVSKATTTANSNAEYENSAFRLDEDSTVNTHM